MNNKDTILNMISFDRLPKNTLPRKVNTSTLKILHGIPNGPNIDLYLNGSLMVSNLSFSSISKYLDVPAGKYTVEIYETGSQDNLVLRKDLSLNPAKNYTFSAVLLDDAPYLFKLTDGVPNYNPLSSYIRFINLSSNSPLLTMKLPNDSILFEEVEYLETTSYYETSPGIYNLKVEFSDASAISKTIKDINMIGGKLYTIYILGLFNSTPPLGYLWVEDKDS